MRYVRHAQSLGFGSLTVCALFLFGVTQAAAVPLPAVHGVAPFGPYIAHLDPLPLEPAPPDYLLALPLVPLVFPGVDAVLNPPEPWHWEVEFMNPNPFAVGPFFAVLTVPGLLPGTAAVVVGPIVLGPGPGTATGALFGPGFHFADPVGMTDLGAFTVTVTNGLPAPINFDFVLVEWDPAMPPGFSGLLPAPPVPLPVGPVVTFAIAPVIMPPPVPSLGRLGLAAAALTLLAAAMFAIHRGAPSHAGV